MSSYATDRPRGRTRTRWVAVAVLVVVTALVLVLATRPAADDSSAGSPLVGQAAPPIQGTALDGRSVDLNTLKGRFVVVNFFATWCVPCRQEHPELMKFVDRHQGANAPTVVAVAFDENDIPAARSFFTQFGGEWPVVPDNAGRIAVDYGVRGLPESYVVDPNGNIAAHITGQVTADGLDGLTGNVS